MGELSPSKASLAYCVVFFKTLGWPGLHSETLYHQRTKEHGKERASRGKESK